MVWQCADRVSVVEGEHGFTSMLTPVACVHLLPSRVEQGALHHPRSSAHPHAPEHSLHADPASRIVRCLIWLYTSMFLHQRHVSNRCQSTHQ